MIIGVLLAGGKGSRFKANNTNKTAVLFNNKPLIQYGVDTYTNMVNKVCIVVGAYKQTVIDALPENKNILFVDKRKRLGTGHAIKLVVESLKKNNIEPTVVLVGNGDHMVFYTEEILKKVVKSHVLNGYDVSVVTTIQDNPAGLGRIIRDSKGNLVNIVEEKDATPKQRKVNEINAGFYCFKYEFLEKNYKHLSKSKVTGEYYITELISMAIAQKMKVKGYKVPFKYVGFGINTREDFTNGLVLYNTR